jgi:PhnB protein
MIGPKPYVLFPGTAREALSFYAEVFGGTLHLHTLAEFGRADGPADDIAHGELAGPVALYGADATGEQDAVSCRGLMLSLLGAADPATLTVWFDRLALGGRVVDDLQPRPWGASDGRVVDRYGLHWLIGFEDGAVTPGVGPSA